MGFGHLEQRTATSLCRRWAKALAVTSSGLLVLGKNEASKNGPFSVWLSRTDLNGTVPQEVTVS